MKNKILIVFIITTVIIGSFIIYILTNEKLEHIEYREFHENLVEGKIKEVKIENNKVKFLKSEVEDEEKWYYTENPHYDEFEEKLLLNGVKVEIESTGEDIAFIVDLLVYVFFFGIIILAIVKLKNANGENFKIVNNTKVKFSDIAGMDDLKQEMRKTIDILKNPKKYKEQGIRPTKGIILEGPPGNGKTLFAKALAGEMNIKFVATKGADFQSAMMSIGSRKIKTLFKKARKNTPCIIFIDEFDGIGERRNYAGTGVDKENNRIITAMLNEMDGFNTEEGILVIAATNSYSSLDSALIRPGRFDLKFTIPNPDINTRLKLIEIYTKNKILDDKIERTRLAESFENLSCSAIETILNEASMNAKLCNRDIITGEDILIASKKTRCSINMRKLIG